MEHLQCIHSGVFKVLYVLFPDDNFFIYGTLLCRTGALKCLWER